MESYEKFFKDKKVLITGGLGFIGSNLVHRLISLDPAKIIIADAQIPNLGANLHNLDGIKYWLDLRLGEKGDLRNTKAMQPLIREADYIFNLAGSVSHVGSKNNPLFDLDLNLMSHVAFLESCRQEAKSGKKIKIVYAGTRDQYGKTKSDELPINEGYLVKDATDPQGISKHAAEFYHFWYANSFGFDASSLRLTNTYGPRHIMTDKDQGVLNWFIRQAMDGERLELWGGGDILRDFNYVGDVVDALLQTVASDKSKGQAYNLGSFRKRNGLYEYIGGNIENIGNVAKKVVKIAGSGSFHAIPYPEDRKSIEPGHFYADATKIYEHLGWGPKTSLDEGIGKTVEFYRKYKEHYW